MKYLGCEVSLQEVPGEISVIFPISGCPHRCPGCHSSELWPDRGQDLTLDVLQHELSRYGELVTCVCFFGGEWEEENLITFLNFSQGLGYKTCLYTGAESISDKLKNNLNYLKLGPWIEVLGGLALPTTNQVFMNLDNGKCLNSLFQHTQGVNHA